MRCEYSNVWTGQVGTAQLLSFACLRLPTDRMAQHIPEMLFAISNALKEMHKVPRVLPPPMLLLPVTHAIQITCSQAAVQQRDTFHKV